MNRFGFSVTEAVRKLIDFKILQKLDKYVYTEVLPGGFVAPLGDMSLALKGLTVDYLTRYMLGGNEKRTLPASRASFTIIGDPDLMSMFEGWSRRVFSIPKEDRELNDPIIAEFLYISAFDQVYRNGMSLEELKKTNVLIPKRDQKSINEIYELVMRALEMFDMYGTPEEIGVYFTNSAFKHNQIVKAGDGDFMSKDTIWDLKVSVYEDPAMEEMCQVICYWLLLRIQDKYEYNNRALSITKLALFNPRYNFVHFLETKDIPFEVTQFLLKNIIGYHHPLECKLFMNNFFKKIWGAKKPYLRKYEKTLWDFEQIMYAIENDTEFSHIFPVATDTFSPPSIFINSILPTRGRKINTRLPGRCKSGNRNEICQFAHLDHYWHV